MHGWGHRYHRAASAQISETWGTHAGRAAELIVSEKIPEQPRESNSRGCTPPEEAREQSLLMGGGLLAGFQTKPNR
jgi:hypothetical protein